MGAFAFRGTLVEPQGLDEPGKRGEGFPLVHQPHSMLHRELDQPLPAFLGVSGGGEGRGSGAFRLSPRLGCGGFRQDLGAPRQHRLPSGDDESEGKRQHHRGARGEGDPVPPNRLTQPVTRGWRTGAHRFIPEMSREIGGKPAGRFVAA